MKGMVLYLAPLLPSSLSPPPPHWPRHLLCARAHVAPARATHSCSLLACLQCHYGAHRGLDNGAGSRVAALKGRQKQLTMLSGSGIFGKGAWCLGSRASRQTATLPLPARHQRGGHTRHGAPGSSGIQRGGQKGDGLGAYIQEVGPGNQQTSACHCLLGRKSH